ncbi:hypothetical protein G4B88_004894 [Cannabis sativa]|uniref:Protein kinase domain-containing protein n=1 Tax=Cannabis sativa TaxID=3483 RepID=A0A7J6FVI7_CANSA|nr:hypothetical protein G4B88_004894 [Cannabis sativa]
MQLKQLCIILPADLDEIDDNDAKKSNPTKEYEANNQSHRSCGSHVVDLIRNYVSEIFDNIRRKRIRRKEEQSGVLFFHDTDGMQLTDKEVGGENPRIFSYSELYIGSNGFSEKEILGSGGFGKVYKAILPSDGTLVAVKCLAEKAAALYYLHEQLESQIIHRDVKTSNVMLDSHYNARLGDFGLARWLEHELDEYQQQQPKIKDNQFRLAETTRIGGTIGYLPPESFQRRSVATAKSDVFSFGIVVLEVVSGRRAVDLTYDDDQIILLDWFRRLSDEKRVLQGGDTRLQDGSFSLSDMERLIHVGLLCTLHNPSSRPNMKWVLEEISGNMVGKLPPLPSFQSHPPYISLSSTTNTSSSNGNSTTRSITITTTNSTTAMSNMSSSSNYVTATGETIYATAEDGLSHTTSTTTKTNTSLGFGHGKVFPMVQTPREISYAEIISATNNFSESKRVAELDFGTAYQGFLNNSHHVLVKRLGMKTCPALRIRFSNELQNLGRSITSSAVILDPDMNPRLTAFALAEFLTRNEHGHHVVTDSKKSVRGIFGYMSPESIESGEATTMADVYSFGVVMLEVVSGQMAVDFRRPEVLLVQKVREFIARQRPLEELADFTMNGEYNYKELMRLIKLGIECTDSNPQSRPSMRQIVQILDGNDKSFMEQWQKKDSIEEWKHMNAPSLLLIKGIQALGIQ